MTHKKKPSVALRNKIWRQKEASRPKLGGDTLAKKRKFVMLTNKLNKIDRARVGRAFSATLSINKKGVIKQRK